MSTSRPSCQRRPTRGEIVRTGLPYGRRTPGTRRQIPVTPGGVDDRAWVRWVWATSRSRPGVRPLSPPTGVRCPPRTRERRIPGNFPGTCALSCTSDGPCGTGATSAHPMDPGLAHDRATSDVDRSVCPDVEFRAFPIGRSGSWARPVSTSRTRVRSAMRAGRRRVRRVLRPSSRVRRSSSSGRRRLR